MRVELTETPVFSRCAIVARRMSYRKEVYTRMVMLIGADTCLYISAPLSINDQVLEAHLYDTMIVTHCNKKARVKYRRERSFFQYLALENYYQIHCNTQKEKRQPKNAAVFLISCCFGIRATVLLPIFSLMSTLLAKQRL